MSLGSYHMEKDVDLLIDFLMKNVLLKYSRILNSSRLAIYGGDTKLQWTVRSRGLLRGMMLQLPVTIMSEVVDVSSIWVYPVKGCQGILLSSWMIAPSYRAALLFDRLLCIDSPAMDSRMRLTSELRAKLVEFKTGFLFVVSEKNEFVNVEDVYVVIFGLGKNNKAPLSISLLKPSSSEAEEKELKQIFNSSLFQTRILFPSQSRFHRRSDSCMEKNCAEKILDKFASKFASSQSCCDFTQTSFEEAAPNACVWVIQSESLPEIRDHFIFEEEDSCTLKSASDWWSSELDHEVVLRRANATESKTGKERNSFANSHDFTIANEATLHQLNASVGVKLSMERFRPNIVVQGFAPNNEETWSQVKTLMG